MIRDHICKLRIKVGQLTNLHVTNVSLFSAYVCSTGYYINIKSNSCLPCPKHTYQPEDEHSEQPIPCCSTLYHNWHINV